MNTEKTIFYYERSRKQQAKVLAFNMIFLPLVMWLFLQLIPETAAVYADVLMYTQYILLTGEVLLLAVLVWFITHPATFYIRLTDSEFSSFHPNFKSWSFSVDPHDIVAIEQSTDQGAHASYISVKMADGRCFLLSPNFAYNRKKLYEALRLANPHIKTPTYSWLFSRNAGM